VGRATVSALHLSDDPDALTVRGYWVLAGWHPPAELLTLFDSRVGHPADCEPRPQVWLLEGFEGACPGTAQIIRCLAAPKENFWVTPFVTPLVGLGEWAALNPSVTPPVGRVLVKVVNCTLCGRDEAFHRRVYRCLRSDHRGGYSHCEVLFRSDNGAYTNILLEDNCLYFLQYYCRCTWCGGLPR